MDGQRRSSKKRGADGSSKSVDPGGRGWTNGNRERRGKQWCTSLEENHKDERRAREGSVSCSHRRISPRGWLGGGEGWAAVVLPVVCRLGERKEEELLKMVADKWVLTGKFNRIKKNPNSIQIWFTLKVTFLGSIFFKYIYREICFDKRNKFCYCNIPRFEIKFESKFREYKSG
jgi:hypothetical protein